MKPTRFAGLLVLPLAGCLCTMHPLGAQPNSESAIDYTHPVENLAHDPDAVEPAHPRNLLTSRFSESWLRNHLLDPEKWVPYPRISERARWGSVSDDVRSSVLEQAESAKSKEWETLTATEALAYMRSGNRSDYSRIFGERQSRLQLFVLAELLQAQGKFLDPITDASWLICEETFWGQPVHIPQMQRSGPGLPNVQEPTIELFAAERGAALSWTYYLLEKRLDTVSPFVRERIAYEIDRRILSPFLARNDFWWMGMAERKDLNNWTPWILSNVLTCALLIERDPAKRAAIAEKSLQILDRYLNRLPADGGCDEGPGYWQAATGSTFDCLDLLKKATDGALDVYSDPLIGKMGRFICDSHVAGEWTLNFGDNSARARPSAMLVYRIGKWVGDTEVEGFGAWLARRERTEGARGSFIRALPSIFYHKDLMAAVPAEPLPRDVFLPDLELAAARQSAGSTRGLYFAMRGYYNAKSHNHNDVGSFMLYSNGEPILIDPGVEEYTTKSFSPERYDIWTMQSAFHNLPTINGQMEEHGSRYRAKDVHYHADDDEASISMDLADAYPESANVASWVRQIAFTRGEKITLTETYRLKSAQAPIVLNLMTACVLDSGTPGKLMFTQRTAGKPGTGAELSYDPAQLSAHVEKIKLSDRNLQSVWGPSLSRIQLVVEHPAEAGALELVFHSR